MLEDPFGLPLIQKFRSSPLRSMWIQFFAVGHDVDKCYIRCLLCLRSPCWCTWFSKQLLYRLVLWDLPCDFNWICCNLWLSRYFIREISQKIKIWWRFSTMRPSIIPRKYSLRPLQTLFISSLACLDLLTSQSDVIIVVYRSRYLPIRECRFDAGSPKRGCPMATSDLIISNTESKCRWNLSRRIT